MNDIKISPNNHHVQKANQQQVPSFVKKFAQNMERQFVEYMMEKMNESTLSEEDKSDAAKSYYRSLLQGEQASIASNVGKGLGIQEMIINDYKTKFHQQPLNIYKQQQKGGGHE